MTENGNANRNANSPVLIGGHKLSIEQLVAVAEQRAPLQLNPAQKPLIDRGAEFLRQYLAGNGIIYGVTTGYGDSVTTAVPDELVRDPLPGGDHHPEAHTSVSPAAARSTGSRISVPDA